jgi:predicted AlkP superfamily phosphohydrolase/phosphomutase
MKKKKVVVIGLDGATFDVMTPLMDKGKLPHIKAVMEKGGYGLLESTIQPMSPQAWSSFITGKNAGKHGIFDFTWRKPHSYEVQLTNASYREGKSLWRILSDHGKSVGIINVPMTYPPEEVNGFLISGMDAPGVNSTFTYPPDLYEEILGHFGKYIIGQRLWEYSRRGKEKELLRALKEMVRLRTDVALHLFDARDCDFFMVVYRATDVVQHIFWKYHDSKHPLHPEDCHGLEDAIFEVYREVDLAVGRFMEKLDDDCSLILISDHGAGGSSNKSIYLNSWLESAGLLRYSDSPEKSGRVLNDRLEQYMLSAKSRLARYIPRKLKLDLQRVMPGVFDKVASISYFSQIDWAKTKAYSEEIRTNVWINLKGREPCGVVEPDEYEPLRDDLIKKIYSIRDPETGRQVFSRVYKKEELYSGKFLETSPDLVLLQDQEQYELTPRSSLHAKTRSPIKIPLEEECKKDTKPSGGHRLNGILVVQGKEFRKGCRIDKANIMDLAPTILYLMGLPIESDMDGQIIEQAFSEDFFKDNAPAYSVSHDEKEVTGQRKEYEEEEEQEIKKRLEGLGYF